MSTAKNNDTKTAADQYATNPYKAEYGNIWADVKAANGIVTKSQLVTAMSVRTGKSEGACSASVGVILSPREASKGDCRGNGSAKGHLYYFGKLKRKVDPATSKKEEQRFRFYWRKDVLPVKTRSEKAGTASDKDQTADVAAPVTTPAVAATPAIPAIPATPTGVSA